MDWTGIGPTMGPIAEEFISYAFLVCTRSSIFCFRSCGASFMFYVYVGVQSTSYTKSSHSLDIMYVAFLLNGFYLFIWGVTFMVSEQSFLRSVDFGVRLVFSVSF